MTSTLRRNISGILGISLPQFWVALMLVMLFSLKLHWLPAFGYGGIQYLILPVVSLALNGISTIARLTRTSMLEVIRSDYVVTATAKGLSRRRVIFVHALPNSIIPVIQSLGTSFGGCLGGAVVIENIFSRLLYGARYSLAIGLQAQVINLLQDLQKEYGLTYMFVTHDLSVVHHISDEISVMYLGQLVETAASAALFERPLHPYTKALLSAIPSVDIHNQREQILIRGELTSPIDPAPGCRFASRCPYETEACAEPQTLRELLPGHHVSCCRAAEIQDLPAGRRRALRAVHCALFSAAAAAMTATYVLERRVRYIRLPDADGGEIN